MEFCCSEMKENVKVGNITFIPRFEYKFMILGQTRLFDDGDGYFDEIQDKIAIKFCPFCGKSL